LKFKNSPNRGGLQGGVGGFGGEFGGMWGGVGGFGGGLGGMWPTSLNLNLPCWRPKGDEVAGEVAPDDVAW